MMYFAYIFLISFSILADPGELLLSTTTSVENSDLLYALLPPFQEESGIRVDVIAVRTGKALSLGESGAEDTIIVHARDVENEFIRRGFGVNRMENGSWKLGKEWGR